MKPHLTLFRVTGIVFAAALLIGPVLGQQPGMPRVNPVTGLPLSSSGDLTNLPPINLLTGLPKLPGMLTPADAITEVYQVANEVEGLSFNHKYDEALKACLAFRKKWRTSASLIPLLPKWVELGRRYPAARAALEELRDRDTREFEEGRGFFALFLEVHLDQSLPWSGGRDLQGLSANPRQGPPVGGSMLWHGRKPARSSWRISILL